MEPEYKYTCFQDLIEDVADDAEAPGAPSWPEPVMWDKSQGLKSDENYKLCVMLPGVALDDWSPQAVYALNVRFKEEFKMTHDIRWIGIVKRRKKRGGDEHAGYDLAFLIHECDSKRVGVGHRKERQRAALGPDRPAQGAAGRRPSADLEARGHRPRPQNDDLDTRLQARHEAGTPRHQREALAAGCRDRCAGPAARAVLEQVQYPQRGTDEVQRSVGDRMEVDERRLWDAFRPQVLLG
jgi:hypothetical protein